jgi:hypothetical protein
MLTFEAISTKMPGFMDFDPGTGNVLFFFL